MKVLLVNKFHYLKGGSETYYFSLKALLEDHGHEVIEFCMKDPQNLSSRFSDYFVENIDYNTNHGFLEKLRLAGKLIYSFEAKEKIEALIKEYKPDIAHLHLFHHQISPSILGVLKKYNIPVVYTAHDFKMICPNYKMMLPSGRLCEECKGERYYKCFKNKCVKNSLSGSLVDAVEAYTHKFMKSYDMINLIITPSMFYRKKFMEFGVQEHRLFYLPNFLDGNEFCPGTEFEDYFIYFGRLSDEKGIETLIKAMKYVEGRLVVAGTGPLESKLKVYMQQEHLQEKVEFVGYKTGKELKEIISKSRFVVVPSNCNENCSYSILEAMASGKGVIGSNMGGIPELIKNNETGLIFNVGDELDLAEKIKFMLANADLVKSFGENARCFFQEKFHKESHYKSIIKKYEELIGGM